MNTFRTVTAFLYQVVFQLAVFFFFVICGVEALLEQMTGREIETGTLLITMILPLVFFYGSRK